MEGGRVNGLNGLFMSPSLYLILTGSTLNCQQHPAYLPEISDGSTGATTSELLQNNKVHKTQFDITKSHDDTQKQQILASFHNYYGEVVTNTKFGFA